MSYDVDDAADDRIPFHRGGDMSAYHPRGELIAMPRPLGEMGRLAVSVITFGCRVSSRERGAPRSQPFQQMGPPPKPLSVGGGCAE